MLIFLSLIIELYFLIHAVIAQSFNPMAKRVIHIELPSKEAKSRNWNTVINHSS